MVDALLSVAMGCAEARARTLRTMVQAGIDEVRSILTKKTLKPILTYISPTSPPYLPDISPISPLLSRLQLACNLPISTLLPPPYLPHTSPMSRPYLPYISPGTRKDGSDADLRFDLPPNVQGGMLPISPCISIHLP